MLLLNGASDVVQVVTASTGAVSVYSAWRDLSNVWASRVGDMGLGGDSNLVSITAATTTAVIAGPSEGVTREVKTVTVRNAHTSTSNVVTVQHTDGTTAMLLWKGTLAASESLLLDNEGKWQHYDAYGHAIVSSSAQAPTTDAAPVDAVAATGTITDGNASNYDANQTITIGTKTYKFVAVIGTTEGNVLIGGSADASLNNLVNAINRDAVLGTPDTDYVVISAHPLVTAAPVGAHATVVTARVKGVLGNSIALSKVGAWGSVSGALLTGGIDGTVGVVGQVIVASGTQPYMCLSTAGITTSGAWKKLSVAAL